MDGVGNKRLPFDPRRGAPCVRVRALQSEDVSEVGWRERRFGSGRSRPTSCEEVNRLFHPASIGGTPPPPPHPPRRSPSADKMGKGRNWAIRRLDTGTQLWPGFAPSAGELAASHCKYYSGAKLNQVFISLLFSLDPSGEQCAVNYLGGKKCTFSLALCLQRAASNPTGFVWRSIMREKHQSLPASRRRQKGGGEGRKGLIGNCRVWKVNRMCRI